MRFMIEKHTAKQPSTNKKLRAVVDDTQATSWSGNEKYRYVGKMLQCGTMLKNVGQCGTKWTKP